MQDALQMALGAWRSCCEMMHDSDRGSQYARGAYQAQLANQGIVCSMSEKGECLDNAVAKQIFGSLKGERTSLPSLCHPRGTGMLSLTTWDPSITASGYIHIWGMSVPITPRCWPGCLNSVSVFT